MAPVLRELRFFADESILGVGKALAAARRDVIYPGHAALPEVPTGTLDPDWMPIVAGMGLVVLARDRRIRTKPVELELLHRHGLRVFWLAGKRDLSSWDYLVRFVTMWSDIERAIASKGPGPWFVGITEMGLRDIDV